MWQSSGVCLESKVMWSNGFILASVLFLTSGVMTAFLTQTSRTKGYLRLAGYLLIGAAVPSAALSQQAQQRVATSSRWLLAYAGKSPSDVVDAPGFQRLLRNGLPHYAASWDSPHSLPQLVTYDLTGSYWQDPVTAVTVQSDRFVSITKTVREEADNMVLLWCDIAKEPPEMIFVYVWETMGNNGLTGSATLDIYTKRPEGASSLAPQFIASVHALMQKAKISAIDGITFHDAENRSTTLSPSSLSSKP
jgi:hypothetical protein